MLDRIGTVDEYVASLPEDVRPSPATRPSAPFG
jgi:hypothetical protein